MKFETAQIHFLSDVYPDILLPWQRDVTTSPLLLDLLRRSNFILKECL